MRKALSLYLRYVSVILQSTMQYKVSFLLMTIARFLIAFNGFLGIYFLFSGFSEIKGYSYGDILLCFSVMQTSFTIAECFASGFSFFAETVKSGEFDRILLRPCSPVLQVLGTKFEIGRLGALGTALITLYLGIRQSQISWSLAKAGTLMLMIAGGALLFAGLFMIGATICFFSLEESGCMNVLTYGAREHGKYPIDIYGKHMLRLCTFLIPYTLIQYYPLQYLLERTPHWYYAFYPLGTIIFLLLCYAFWRFGMHHYKSSGS